MPRLPPPTIPPSGVPENLGQFYAWLKKHKKWNVPRINSQYSAFTHGLRNELNENHLLKTIRRALREVGDKYRMKTGYDAFQTTAITQIAAKPFDSCMSKLLRKTFIKNEIETSEINENWPLLINDIVRTRAIANFIDTAEIMSDELIKCGTDAGLKTYREYKAHADGYFAIHCYFHIPVSQKLRSYFDIGEFSFEVQVSTQLQDALYKILHKIYAQSRESFVTVEKPIGWRAGSIEFVASSAGHMLRGVEGLVMDVRQRQTGTHDD